MKLPTGLAVLAFVELRITSSIVAFEVNCDFRKKSNILGKENTLLKTMHHNTAEISKEHFTKQVLCNRNESLIFLRNKLLKSTYNFTFTHSD